jgi:hypothetical protein
MKYLLFFIDYLTYFIKDFHMYMTSAKAVQYIKRSNKGESTASKIDDTFSLKLNAGRPNLNKVNS